MAEVKINPYSKNDITAGILFVCFCLWEDWRVCLNTKKEREKKNESNFSFLYFFCFLFFLFLRFKKKFVFKILKLY